MASPGWSARPACKRSTGGFDLATLEPPITLVHVRTDTQVPLAAVERTAAHLPDPEIVRIERGDHCDDASIAATLDLIARRHAA